MLSPFTLAVLLASMIVSPVEAVPHRRNVGLITLPLTRMHKVRDDIHPQIVSRWIIDTRPHLMHVYSFCNSTPIAHTVVWHA